MGADRSPSRDRGALLPAPAGGAHGFEPSHIAIAVVGSVMVPRHGPWSGGLGDQERATRPGRPYQDGHLVVRHFRPDARVPCPSLGILIASRQWRPLPEGSDLIGTKPAQSRPQPSSLSCKPSDVLHDQDDIGDYERPQVEEEEERETSRGGSDCPRDE